MSIARMPGRNSRTTAYVNTHRVTLPYCSGSCSQGRGRCDCPTGSAEMSADIPLRPEFPAPKGTAEIDAIGRIFGWTYAATLAGVAVSIAILACWPN